MSSTSKILQKIDSKATFFVSTHINHSNTGAFVPSNVKVRFGEGGMNEDHP